MRVSVNWGKLEAPRKTDGQQGGMEGMNLRVMIRFMLRQDSIFYLEVRGRNGMWP